MLQLAEVSPVDLRLLAGQRAQAQVGLGRRARADAGDERRGSARAARVAALGHHRVQPAGGERGDFCSVSSDEGQVRVDAAGPQRRGVRRRAVPARARAARCRGARATGARWCPRATSRPCTGAGSAPPDQGLWSWRRLRQRRGSGRGAGSPGAPRAGRDAAQRRQYQQRRGAAMVLRRAGRGGGVAAVGWTRWSVACPCRQWSSGHPRPGTLVRHVMYVAAPAGERQHGAGASAATRCA